MRQRVQMAARAAAEQLDQLGLRQPRDLADRLQAVRVQLLGRDAADAPEPLDRRRALDATLDDLRDRFGSSAITRAVLLGRDAGMEVPLLPD